MGGQTVTNQLSDYNLWLVLLSYVVSVTGAMTGLLLTGYIRRPDGGISFWWLSMASMVIGGCAIWSMHFLGMLAYSPGHLITYDINITAASLVIAVVVTGAGLYCVYRWHSSAAALLAGGMIMGSGVAAMHYTGMAAMRMNADMSYDPTILTASIVIALVAATVALFTLERARGLVRYASAPVLGLAICGMHYTGMAAMELSPATSPVDFFSGTVTEQLMGMPVTMVALAVCISGIYMVIDESHRRSLRAGSPA